MKFVLVGGNGYVGRGLQAAFLRRDHEVLVIDSPEDLFDLKGHRLSGDVIVNLVACGDKSRAYFGEESLWWRLNIEATNHLLGLAQEASMPFIFVSTREVLGDVYAESDVVEDESRLLPKWTIDEGWNPAPQNAFGRSRLVGEWLTRAYESGYVVRLATPYSSEVPAPNRGGGLVSTLVKKARGGGPVGLAKGGGKYETLFTLTT